MATLAPKTINFIRPAAPNLPLATADYQRQYQDQFANVLRLYFNQLDNTFGSLLGPDGGKYLKFPYGAFHQDGITTLSTSITNTSTTPISVASTAPFPPAGYILIDAEIIQYTGTTSTTFTGITRAVLGTSQVAHTAGAQITEVQGTGSGTTIGTLRFNNTDYSNDVAVSSTDNTQIVFSTGGLYNIQISLQLLNYTNAVDNITVWFRLNGADIANTASIQAVPSSHGGVPGATVLAFNIYQTFNANDYLQAAWTSDSGNSVVATYPAGITPVHPVSPAAILTAQFVSAVT